jgi:hypothetical protein
MMSNDVPLLVRAPYLPSISLLMHFQVAYEFGHGHIRYYLAPKIGDD